MNPPALNRWRSRAHVVVLGAVAAAAIATPAGASPQQCQRTIAGKFAKFVQQRVKLLQKCHEHVVIGKRPGPCPDAATAPKLARLQDKLASAIHQHCGGPDKNCGVAVDESLASIGWDLGSCPGFEGACTAPIAHCGDVAACLTCVGTAAIDQAMSLAYDGLTASAPNGELNRCQATIGRSLARYFTSKAAALAKCEDKILKGLASGPCPDAAKTAPRIERAAAKVSLRICRACGGFDQNCGGGDDFSAAQIGFASACPDVTVPNGPSCGASTTPLSALATCAGCVTDFKTDCLDAVSVPALKSYPSECQATAPPAATTTATPVATPVLTATATPTVAATPTRTTTPTAGVTATSAVTATPTGVAATPTLTLPLPTLSLPLPTVTLPLPSITLPLPTLTLPLPSITLPLPSVTLPLPSLTLPLPTLTLPPLPTITLPLPTETPVAGPTPTLTLPLPSLTLPLPTLMLPLPTLTLPLPSLTLPLPTLAIPLLPTASPTATPTVTSTPALTATPTRTPTPTPTATPNCGDGVIVPPETCETGIPCGLTNVCVACAACV